MPARDAGERGTDPGACVAGAGFMYWPDDPNHELTQDTLPFARTWGYGGLSLEHRRRTTELNAAFVRSLSLVPRPRAVRRGAR